MPIMNAMFLDSDPDGAELLRSVLETGRRGRRRKINDILGVRDLRMADAGPIMVEIGETDEEMHPGVFAARRGGVTGFKQRRTPGRAGRWDQGVFPKSSVDGHQGCEVMIPRFVTTTHDRPRFSIASTRPMPVSDWPGATSSRRLLRPSISATPS